MIDEIKRNLTTMEYVILGLLSAAPQTGYALISTMEMTDGRWSASSGSIYPALKRLERQGVIEGHVEAVYTTRPRKVYRITALGDALLDSWVKTTQGVDLNDREIPLIKFLFAEQRMSRDEVLQWLDNYEQCMDAYEFAHEAWQNAQFTVSSVHQQLLVQATVMEWKMQREWIRVARERLLAEKAAPTTAHLPERLAS